MVGRGEVDEDLEGETKEECEKYGKVVKCVIFEVSDGSVKVRLHRHTTTTRLSSSDCRCTR